MANEIPIGAVCELRQSKEDWRLVAYWDNDVPRFCRQYVIQSLQSGQTRRCFKHELFEKNTCTYQELYDFFREQMSQEMQDDFLNESMNEHENDTGEPLVSPSDTNERSEIITDEEAASITDDDAVQMVPDTEAGPKKKRFKSVTEKDVELLASKTTEPTTNAMTKWAIKIFKEWITENQPQQDTESLNQLSPEQLDDFLARFYASLQTRKGSDYSKSALNGLRAGINRYFTQPPNNKQFNIMKDRAFQKSNNVLCGIIKEQKRAGKDVTENKEPISTADLNKLQESGLLSTETPQTLQNKVFFDVMTHFGRRGREGLRSLKPTSFKIMTDSDEHRYVSMTYNEADKTHHGVDSREKAKAPRMYETKLPSCPVRSFEKYISKLNPENDSFFQKPLTKFHKEGPVWYGKTPVGVNQLYNFMPRLSAEAGLSKRYTNHCIRAMVASTLSNAGVSNIGIMSVTGHRNVQSLTSYVKPSDYERRTISGILSGEQPETHAVPVVFPQSRFLGNLNHPTRQDMDNNLSQINSQSNTRSNTFSIFSGNITGGNITVNLYRE